MKSEIRDGNLFVEGESSYFDRLIVRSIHVDVTNPVFITGYSSENEKMKRKIWVSGKGHLPRDKLVSLCGHQRTDAVNFEIHAFDQEHYDKYGDKYALPEWGAKVSFFPKNDESFAEDTFFITISVPESVIEEMRQPILHGRLERILVFLGNEELWVREGSYYWEDPAHRMEWFIAPRNDDRIGSQRAALKVNGLSWSLKSETPLPPVEPLPEGQAPPVEHVKRSGWFR